jgi:mannose-1-phosphate guanylyltransferase/mannose-6-phosphate isomerase
MQNLINVTPVILCGGSGTRLWPLSRTGFPKQFLCLTGQYSLFQLAAMRLAQLGEAEIVLAPPLLVTGENHRFLAVEQLRESGISLGHALLEPVGRNTAAALTFAALAAQATGQDPVLVVTPSDQTVADPVAFTRAMQKAIREANCGAIVILGVTPDRPETGYGYIKAERNAFAALPVKCFVEKPDAATAQSYIDSGEYFWNAGMFVLKASVWLQALEQFRPDILQATCISWQERREDSQFIRPGEASFKAIPSASIDYAVMEHAPEAGLPIKVVPLNAGWSDLGAWEAVWNMLPKDAAGNTQVGDVQCIDSRNTMVHATSRLVGVIGVNNLIVIETADAVLVVDRTRSQDVKQIVKALSAQGREELTLHRKVHRPWGWYDSIDEGGRFKVKRILVKPGASLSLQKHHHRAEHWVVVKGTADITNGDKKLLLSENQSTYIPLGEVHRLANPGTIPLEIIEVQSGSYLGEDDIVRFEDHYGRQGEKPQA